MVITNDTLMWLAPLAGAAAMTVTAVVAGYFDTHRPPQASPALPSNEGTAVEVNAAIMEMGHLSLYERIIREATGDELTATRAVRGITPNEPRPTPGMPTTPSPRVR